MTYSKGFIACVKVNGKVLREDADIVTLPFGAEYSVLLKNLTSVRAQVKVSVDGTDATEGTWLIVPANGELELERYIRNGNFDKGNRFKFIERTGQIEANKGIGASDGLIRVEYKSEVVQKVVDQTIIRRHYHDEYFYYPRPYIWSYPRPYYPWSGDYTITCNNTGGEFTKSGNIQGGQNSALGSKFTTSYNTSTPPSKGRSPLRSGSFGSARAGSPLRSMKMSASAAPPRNRMVQSAALNDVGITVPGSESSQKFVSGAWFKTKDTSHVIVLQLRGRMAGKVVKTAVTVKSKAKCETCGTVNKSSMKFCGKCGTSLTII